MSKYDKYALVTLSEYNKQYTSPESLQQRERTIPVDNTRTPTSTKESTSTKGKRYIKIPRDHLIQHLYSVLERIDMSDAEKMAVFNEVYRDLETKAKNAEEKEQQDKVLMPPPSSSSLIKNTAADAANDSSKDIFGMPSLSTQESSTPRRLDFTLGTTDVAEQLTDKLKNQQQQPRKKRKHEAISGNKDGDDDDESGADDEINDSSLKRLVSGATAAARIPSSVYVSPGVFESPSGAQAQKDEHEKDKTTATASTASAANNFSELINNSLPSLFIDQRGMLCFKDTQAPIIMNSDAGKIFKHLTDPAQRGVKRPNGCGKFLEILARAGLGRNLIKNVDDQQYYDELYNPDSHALQYDDWQRF